MTLEEKLKSVCKSCTKATIKTYARNIRRVYGLTHTSKEATLDSKWLNDTLLKKIKDLPLNVRRHLSIAAVKFAQAVKAPQKTIEKFTEQMLDDSLKYKQKRGKNEWSDKELAKKPKGGMKSIKKASTQILAKVKRLIENEKEPQLKTLFKYQAYLLLKLYLEVPLRNLFATLDLDDKKTNNYIKTGKGNSTLVIRHHKNSKKTGGTEIKLSRAATMAVRKFLKYKDKVHDKRFLLTNMKGEKLSKQSLSKMLHRVTSDTLGKAFGSRMIRVLAATEKKDEIQQVQKLAKNMLHSVEQQATYVRKDKKTQS